MIYAIVGHSASGKSTIERQLETLGIPRIISVTTRPMRDGEVNGIDYHYITEEEFFDLKYEGALAEHAKYRDWWYGLSLDDVNYTEEDYVVVVTPKGYRELLDYVGKEYIKSIFIAVTERDRLIRLANRGDDVDEIIRRILADREDFKGFEDEADFVMSNQGELDVAVKNLYNMVSAQKQNKTLYKS